jgi:hypothetical protein
MLNLLKFQILFIYIYIYIYMTEGSSVRGNVIQGDVQTEHSCHISTWWPSKETGLTWSPRHSTCWQPISCNSSCKCMATMWRRGNRLPNGTIHFHLAGTMWWWQSKWTTKFLDDRSQHCTHPGTHSHRQMCTCVAHGTWLWIMLQHCAVYHGGCVTVP